jgi:CheY-like chemotaxis protein
MSAGHSVLVVDDDPDLRDTVADALEYDGIDVKVAENGRVALDMLLAGARPHVILLDLMMPEMDGWTFRAEQQKHPAIASIPVVVFSAYGMPDTAQRMGAQAYLKKPPRLDELLTTINRFRPDARAPANE